MAMFDGEPYTDLAIDVEATLAEASRRGVTSFEAFTAERPRGSWRWQSKHYAGICAVQGGRRRRVIVWHDGQKWFVSPVRYWRENWPPTKAQRAARQAAMEASETIAQYMTHLLEGVRR
jgi:hypothetical protein